MSQRGLAESYHEGLRRAQRGRGPQPTWEGEAGVMKRTNLRTLGQFGFV